MNESIKPSTDSSRLVGALSRKESAAYIGVSTRQLDQFARAGDLRRVKLGAKTVFRIVDLEAFLESRLQNKESAE